MVSYLPEIDSSKNDNKKWEDEFKSCSFLLEKQTIVGVLIGFYRTKKVKLLKNIWQP